MRALAGPDARLREDQWTAVRALVEDRRRALVVQRTGWGKSAVYFTATALGNGQVLIAGGSVYTRSSALDSAELYDIDSGQFRPAGKMTAARTNSPLMRSPAGKHRPRPPN